MPGNPFRKKSDSLFKPGLILVPRITKAELLRRSADVTFVDLDLGQRIPLGLKVLTSKRTYHKHKDSRLRSDEEYLSQLPAEVVGQKITIFRGPENPVVEGNMYAVVTTFYTQGV